MTVGRALLKSFLPAIVIGPMLGIVGASVLMIVSAAMTGGNSGAGGIFVLVWVFGALLGLVIAAPICLAFGAAMLVMASKNARWAERAPIVAIGFLVGATAGAAVGIGEGALAILFIGISGGVLGAVGALLFRRMTKETLVELNAVDPSVFS